MASCINCSAYTKFDGGLCLDCYRSSKESEQPETGLTNKEWTYRYNMIKGRIAETLIQELFLSLKYNVFRYGMENTIPGIMELLKGVKSEVAEEIKRMPDFVIQNSKTSEVYFVEVKFRANEKFTFKELPKDYAWENAYFVVVSKKHIKCVSFQELKEGREITPESKNYLGYRKEFNLDKDTIIAFCEFAVRFFEHV